MVSNQTPSQLAAARLITAVLIRGYSADLPALAKLLTSPRLRGELSAEELRRLDELASLAISATDAASSVGPSGVAADLGVDRAAKWIARERRVAFLAMGTTVLLVAGLVAYGVASLRISQRLGSIEMKVVELQATSETLSRLVADKR